MSNTGFCLDVGAEGSWLRLEIGDWLYISAAPFLFRVGRLLIHRSHDLQYEDAPLPWFEYIPMDGDSIGNEAYLALGSFESRWFPKGALRD